MGVKAFRYILSLFAFLFIFAAGGQLLAESGESVSNFESHLLLKTDGSVQVTELISYDFGSNQRRGLFREIPVHYQLDDNRVFEIGFELISVSRLDTDNEEYQLSQANGVQLIRIGNPNASVSGIKTYEITYVLRPVVLQTDEGDIFRFNIIGDGWQVPVKQANAILETEILAENTLCYTGILGGNTGQCAIDEDNGIYRFESTEELSAGEDLTIEAVFASDSFTAYPVLVSMAESPSFDNDTEYNRYIIAIILGSVLVVIGAASGMLSGYLRFKLRRRKELIITQYEPPDNLTPAEVGLLNDNISNTVEFTATLIDLAVRGHLRIEQLESAIGRLFGGNDYRFHLLKPFEETRDYEKILLEQIFDGVNSIKLSELIPAKMENAIKEFHQKLIDRLEKKGYYYRELSWYKNYKKLIVLLSILIGALFFVFPFIAIVLLFVPPAIASWKGGGVLYSRITHKGFTGWAHIEGFKDFLRMTEKERIAFHEAPVRNPEQFSRLLSYAIALGVEKEWSKQFEGINVIRDNGWYVGSKNGSISSTAFLSDLSGKLNAYSRANFSRTVSGGRTRSRTGSFSGGGVGGGRGGSW